MVIKYLYDRILGGLYGQAFGDSFGIPAMLRPSETRKRFGWITTFLDAPDDHPAHHGLKAGRITDDTEQALSLATVIIKEQGISVTGAAKAIIAWYDRVDGDHNDYVGPSTRRAVGKLKQGYDPRLTGRQGDTDGGAMRISPVGLINPGNLERAVSETATSCIPTHNTDVAISGAAAIAGAISTAMLQGSSLQDIITASRTAATMGLKYGEPWLGASIPRRIDLAIELGSQEKELPGILEDIYDLVGAGLATSEAVPAAIGVFHLAGGDLVKTAQLAANLSGDADTVAAMACAIAGAWHGFSCFPGEIITKIDQVNPEWDIKKIAAGLTDLVMSRDG
jgi:ADP-ribosylglycohydrolase